jgi:transposase
MATALAIRKLIVNAYKEGLTDTYEATAAMFSVGRATVDRLLRLDREGKDLAPQRGGKPPRRVDLLWLKSHVEAHEDARLIDRIDAWEAHSGVRVSIGAMWNALAAIGVTHKKRRR